MSNEYRMKLAENFITPATDEILELRIAEITRAVCSSPIPLELFPAPPAKSIAGKIDHTLLAPSATEAEIDKLCDEAIKYGFATVCVRPNYVSRAAQNLKNAQPEVTTVISFPEGTNTTDKRIFEAREAIKDGATELDMVMNYGWLKEKRYSDVFEEIRTVRLCSRAATLKVILEISQFDHQETIAASVVACLAGADYVKTSTGFNGTGADLEHVALMTVVCGSIKTGAKVKASGGIRTLADCVKFIRAGAERVGTSAGVKIVEEALNPPDPADQEAKKTEEQPPQPVQQTTEQTMEQATTETTETMESTDNATDQTAEQGEKSTENITI